jgi:hypothetical protein
MSKVNHGWLYGNVKPYFEQRGFKLLKDDMLFIERCLTQIPQERHRRVMRDYLVIWDATIRDKDNGVSIALNPRFEANVYLRNTAGILCED